MAERSAHATIKGYFYQFDKTILELLEATSPDSSVVVEGIEDIDLNDGIVGSLTQCKYYEGTEYVHSVIKDAVIYMLRHFKTAGCPADQTLRYRIYGHYKKGQGKLPASLNLTFLKKHFLSYSKEKVAHEVHTELGVSDPELSRFLELLDINLRAPAYDAQQKTVYDSITRSLPNGSVADAQTFYYPRAINVIQKLAVEADVSKRTIKKADFIAAVDRKEVVLSRWLREKFGDEHYSKSIKRKHFTFSGLKIPKGSRVFAIDIAGEFDLPKAAALLNKIGTLFSHKEHKRTLENERFCPYIILNGIQDTDMATLKAALYRQGIFFEDGHPFLGSDFYPARLTAPLTPGFPIKLKFIPSAEHLAPSFAGVHGTSIEVFDFFKTSPLDRRFRLPDAVHNEIQIPHTYFISEILKS